MEAASYLPGDPAMRLKQLETFRMVMLHVDEGTLHFLEKCNGFF